MEAAARAGDWATLQSYMDMEAVRRASVAEAEEGLRGALKEIREADSAATRGYAEGEAEEWRRKARAGPAELAGDVVGALGFRWQELIEGSLYNEPRFGRRGLDEFTMRRNGTPSSGTFVFRRHGLGWRLDAVKWGFPEELGPP